jgi:hypothetical protein
MERPNVPKALAIARRLGWSFDIMSTSFFLSRRTLRPAANSKLPRWQDRLFIGLARSASDATDYFQIPTGRVVEGGNAGDGVIFCPVDGGAGRWFHFAVKWEGDTWAGSAGNRRWFTI